MRLIQLEVGLISDVSKYKKIGEQDKLCSLECLSSTDLDWVFLNEIRRLKKKTVALAKAHLMTIFSRFLDSFNTFFFQLNANQCRTL